MSAAKLTNFERSAALYRQYVNPLWLDTLSEIGLFREFASGEGAYLIDAEGNQFLDFVAGFGAASLGHAHPRLRAILTEASTDAAPGIVPWGISAQTGQLAAKLCELAGQHFAKVYFASGGAEAIDAALKFAAAATGRSGFLSFTGGFHGLTVATTGLSAGIWSEPFPQIWPDVLHVSPKDLSLVNAALISRPPAAIVLEIVQGTGGAYPWEPAALRELASMAESVGSLIIVDEVMSGLGRTGEWFAFANGNSDFRPDMVVVSKTLTGGLIPVSAVLMREEVFGAVYAGRSRAKIHGSTFSSARIGMTCGLAVLDIMEKDDLLQNVQRMGQEIRAGLDTFVSRNRISEVRGKGLMLGIGVAVRNPEERAYAATKVCLGLMERGVLTHVAGHDPGLLRITPPFIVTKADVSLFLDALEDTLTEITAVS